jgi:hypothetical protein
MVPNDTARDERLSFRARGILTFLLSQQPGWDITTDETARHGREGREAVRAAYRELEDAGYVRRSRIRDDDGQITGHIFLYPYGDAPERTTAGIQSSVNQPLENLTPDFRAQVLRSDKEDCEEDFVDGTVVTSSPSPNVISTSAPIEVTSGDTVSEPPPLWVQELPWLNPREWQKLTSAIHHVDLVTEVGTYITWTTEHSVRQSPSGFWAWVSKHEATAKTDVSAEEREREGMRAIMRLAQTAEEQS